MGEASSLRGNVEAVMVMVVAVMVVMVVMMVVMITVVNKVVVMVVMVTCSASEKPLSCRVRNIAELSSFEIEAPSYVPRKREREKGSAVGHVRGEVRGTGRNTLQR